MSTFCDMRSAIAEMKSNLRGKKLVLFLDFDGTLAEIQTIPDNTYMTKDMSNVLTEISLLEDVMTVAISGRKIEDLQRRIGVDNMIYSGNHGLEMCMDNESPVTYCLDEERLALLRSGIRNIVKELKDKKLGKECGGNIEDKDTALTWHFFQVPPNEAEAVVKQACSIVRKQGFPIFDGVGCIEVRHPNITKGDAMKQILYEKIGPNWHETHSAIFIGDSSSDEDGYLALCEDPDFKSEYVTFIRIFSDLEHTTSGQYVFRGCDDVYMLLNALNDFYSNQKHLL